MPDNKRRRLAQQRGLLKSGKIMHRVTPLLGSSKSQNMLTEENTNLDDVLRLNPLLAQSLDAMPTANQTNPNFYHSGKTFHPQQNNLFSRAKVSQGKS